MASTSRTAAHARGKTLSNAAFVDLSLRNHLCFFALETEHGTAFHLGTIVRTMFASFFLFEAGFGAAELTLFTEADIQLGETVLSSRPGRPWNLAGDAVKSTADLLRLYDSQLQSAPLTVLVDAHRLAERNFQAAPNERMSIAALVERANCSLSENSQY